MYLHALSVGTRTSDVLVLNSCAMPVDTREKIVRAAAKAFAEKGFRGATTLEIAAAARVNEATLYRLFKTKRNLYAEAARHALERDFAAQQRKISECDNPKDVILGLIKSYREDPTAVRIIYSLALEGRRAKFPVAAQADRFLTFVRDTCTRLKSRNGYRPVSDLGVAMVLAGIAFYHVLAIDILGVAPVQVGSTHEDTLLESYEDILLRGLLNHTERSAT